DHVSQSRARDSSFVNQLDVGGSLTGGSVRLEAVEETTRPLIRGNGRREGNRINFRCGGPFGRRNHAVASSSALVPVGVLRRRGRSIQASDEVAPPSVGETFFGIQGEPTSVGRCTCCTPDSYSK